MQTKSIHPRMENLPKVWVLDSSASGKKTILRAIQDFCKLSFFNTFESFFSALESQSKQNKGSPHLLLCEAILEEGFIIELFKKVTIELPSFIVLSKDNSFEVMSSCLEFGAEDYLLKPVNTNLLRVKLKRWFELEKQIECRRGLQLQLDPLSLQLVHRDGKKIKLTNKEFQIFSCLYDGYPKARLRDEIIQFVWGEVRVVQKAFDVHLFQLRKKLVCFGLEIQFSAGASYLLVPKSDR